MSRQSLFLFALDPPADDPEQYFECELIPGSPVRDQFAVRVSPPLISDGVEYDQLTLRGRGEGELSFSDDLSSVDLGPSGLGAVFVSPHHSESSFKPYEGVVGEHLPEHVKHGGYWRWFCDSMDSFVTREGGSDVPAGHVEGGFELGRYLEGLRTAHDYRTLTSEQLEYLESVPGWTWSDSPRSAAIRFTTALREGDVAGIESLLCNRIIGSGKLDLGRPSTLGDLADYVRAWYAYASKASFASVSHRRTKKKHVTTDTPETGPEAKVASIELQFRGEHLVEVWRLHTVLEDDGWKVCSAEMRDQYPDDPTDTFTRT